jgi:hypothetical protein
MNFDPAIEAQLAFRRAQAAQELGAEWDLAEELEESFSASAGAEASHAYRRLVSLGERHQAASAFQEFLIYITWQQVTEETIPEHFERGARLCERFLSRRYPGLSAQTLSQVQALHLSFRQGLGLGDHHDLAKDYERDTPKGGD